MMLDRTTNPSNGKIARIPALNVECIILKNGIEFYFINDDYQEVCQLDVCFPSGNIYQPKPLVSSAVCRMLEEGTKNKSGTQLIEAFDYYGAYIETNPGADHVEISLYGLNKHAEKTIPLLREMVSEPAFNDEDLQRYAEQRKQSLEIHLNKVDFVAGRKFENALFGNSHPYGIEVMPEAYDNLTADDLTSFHTSHYMNCRPKLFAAGKINKRFIEIVEAEFGALNFKGDDSWNNIPVFGKHLVQTGRTEFKMEGQIQSGLKVGKLSVGIDHVDIHRITVLSTVLGGYFGSRLMMNIREDKGYTYGIGSYVRNQKAGSYMGISTQVANEVYINTLIEISNEIHRLQTEKIGDSELNLVKNYLLGGLLRNFDGAFEKMSRFKSLNYNNLTESYFEDLLETISSIDSVQLLQTANEHMTSEDFTEIVAGLA